MAERRRHPLDRRLRLQLRAPAPEQAGLRAGDPRPAARRPPARDRLDPAARISNSAAICRSSSSMRPGAWPRSSARCRCSPSPCSTPSAALLLAISTWQIKYTSQIMLEPLPGLLSTVTVVAYLAWQRLDAAARSRRRWLPVALLALSAVAFGLTESAKFTYGVAGVAVLVDWLWRARPDWPPGSRQRLRVGVPVAAARARSGSGWPSIVFVASNPRMWADPLPRLRESSSTTGPTRRATRCSPPTSPHGSRSCGSFSLCPGTPASSTSAWTSSSRCLPRSVFARFGGGSG